MKIGTKVTMINCHEATKNPDKIWVTRSEPWEASGSSLVLLEGKTGGFDVSCLKIIEEEKEEKMKRFKSNRTLSEIIEIASNSNWDVDKEDFEKGGDWIWLRDMDGRFLQVRYNTCNGQFFVWDPSSEKPVATHMSKQLDDEIWYIELLNMFYLP